MKQLSENLKYLRRSDGLTVAKISEKLHVNPRTYEAWQDRGIAPPLWALVQLSQWFRVSIEYMVRKDLSQLTWEQIEIDYQQTLKRLQTSHNETENNQIHDIQKGAES